MHITDSEDRHGTSSPIINQAHSGYAARPRLLAQLCARMIDVTVRIGDIVIDSSDPERAAAFWCDALGYRVADSDSSGVAIVGASSAPTMLFLHSTDRKLHKNRIHFDVCPTHGTTRDEEVARLETLGARRYDAAPSERSWVTMMDPDGNEFCVMSVVLPGEPAPFHHL